MNTHLIKYRDRLNFIRWTVDVNRSFVVLDVVVSFNIFLAFNIGITFEIVVFTIQS